MRPAAFGSGGTVVDPPLPVDTLPAVPVIPPPPNIALAPIDPSHATPSRLAPQIAVIKRRDDGPLMMFAPSNPSLCGVSRRKWAPPPEATRTYITDAAP